MQNNMTKQSIKSFWLTPTIPIVQYSVYNVELNPIDNQFWIYTVWGMSPISKEILNKYFI